MNRIEQLNRLAGLLTHEFPCHQTDKPKGFKFVPGGGFLIYGPNNQVNLTLQEAQTLMKHLQMAFAEDQP